MKMPVSTTATPDGDTNNGNHPKLQRKRYVSHSEPLDNTNELCVCLVDNGDQEGTQMEPEAMLETVGSVSSYWH